MYPGSWRIQSKGGVSSRISCASRRTSCALTTSIAPLARRRSARIDNTAQDWVNESSLHSSFCTDPSGVPSSKYARRYHPPSHASSSEPVNQSACVAVTIPAVVLIPEIA